MERHQISVTKDKLVYHFEIADYMHHSNEHCKYDVFYNNALVARFEPNPQQILHICKNTGTLDEELLHLLADEIENHHWS